MNDPDHARRGYGVQPRPTEDHRGETHIREAKEQRLYKKGDWRKGGNEIAVRDLSLINAPSAVKQDRLVQEEDSSMPHQPDKDTGKQCHRRKSPRPQP